MRRALLIAVVLAGCCGWYVVSRRVTTRKPACPCLAEWTDGERCKCAGEAMLVPVVH
jgi:hypothetical protein